MTRTQQMTVRLSDFCQTGSGSTPSRMESRRYYESGTIPWVKSGELREAVITSTEENITKAALKETSVKLVPEGAILLAMYGATVGRLAILGVEATTNQAVCHILPDLKVSDTRYVYHAIAAQVPQIISMGVGGAQPNINQGLIKNLKIPLPTLPEQRRIAAILDKADALRIKRREAIEQLDSLAQSIFIEMFGNAEKHIQNGCTRTLSDVVADGKMVTYGIVQAGPEVSDGVPYIKTGDIKGGYILEQQLSRTSPAIAEAYARSAVSAGDIVMSIRATVGTTAVVPPSLNGANLTQGTARISPGGDVRATYLLAYLRTDAVQRWIQSQVKGATFREITLGRLRDLPVYVPPLKLQEDFVERMNAIGEINASNLTSLNKFENLFASLQHRAFRGEL